MRTHKENASHENLLRSTLTDADKSDRTAEFAYVTFLETISKKERKKEARKPLYLDRYE